jgi:hypothetical protein
MKRWFYCLTLLSPLLSLAADLPDSPAQVALFDSDHLKNVTRPVTLDYSFSRKGAPTIAYEDHVSAEIRAVHEGDGKDVWISFLSGERQMPTTPVIDFHGNPLLMYFLEHDVLEMKQDTGVPSAYFRNHMRRVFYDGAKITPVTITVAGKERVATAIDITPFAGDPNLNDFPAMAAKSYRFILCDQVPGTLYQIMSRSPAIGQFPAIDEEMTFTGAKP